MTTTTRTVTVTVLKRDWNDIEPKILTFLATGLTATAVVSAGDYVGIHIPVGLAMLIVLIVGGIAGYAKASTSKVRAAGGILPAPVAPEDVVAAPVAPEVAPEVVAPVVAAAPTV